MVFNRLRGQTYRCLGVRKPGFFEKPGFFSRENFCLQLRVTVSYKFKITRATLVQAANSAWSASPAARRETDFQNGPRRLSVLGVSGFVFFQQRRGDLDLVLARGTLQGLAPSPRQPSWRVAAALLQDACGERPGRFDVRRIVQQHEGLLRDVRPVAVGGALLAAGRVEGQHTGMRERPLPPGVHSRRYWLSPVSATQVRVGKFKFSQ